MTQIKLKNNYCLGLIFLILSSCVNKTEKRIIGDWSIDLDSCRVCHRKWDILGNSITFYKDYACSLPEIFQQSQNDNVGRWFLHHSIESDSLFLDVPNNPLYGKYKIELYKDYKNQLFKMKLENDSTILVCSKFLQNFNSNTDWSADHQ